MTRPQASSTDALSFLQPARDEHGRRASTIDALYRRLAPVYDIVYGVGLEHGRRRAMRRLAPRLDERILEVGVGTGLSARGYPDGCRVAAIDLSAQMLARARTRLLKSRVETVALCQMDAASLAFPDATFDAVYAPYVLNVVSDPLGVVAEMLRVCRPGGRLVLLNHFAPRAGANPAARAAWRLAARIGGISWHVELHGFLAAAGLTAVCVDEVNFRVSSVVLCHKPFRRGDRS